MHTPGAPPGPTGGISSRGHAGTNMHCHAPALQTRTHSHPLGSLWSPFTTTCAPCHLSPRHPRSRAHTHTRTHSITSPPDIHDHTPVHPTTLPRIGPPSLPILNLGPHTWVVQDHNHTPHLTPLSVPLAHPHSLAWIPGIRSHTHAHTHCHTPSLSCLWGLHLPSQALTHIQAC